LPKGVQITHGNILANMAGVYAMGSTVIMHCLLIQSRREFLALCLVRLDADKGELFLQDPG